MTQKTDTLESTLRTSETSLQGKFLKINNADFRRDKAFLFFSNVLFSFHFSLTECPKRRASTLKGINLLYHFADNSLARTFVYAILQQESFECIARCRYFII